MKNISIGKILLIFSFCVVASSASRATNYLVSTLATLQITMAAALPGDTVSVQDGTYNWGAINFTNNNGSSSSAWIVLKAQSFNNVIFTGNTYLSFAGTHILITGFRFASGSVGTNSVIQFRNSSNVGANYCRVNNITIDNYNSDSSANADPGNPGVGIDNKWVSLYGTNNRLDHCTFINKFNAGATVVVWYNNNNYPQQSTSTYHRIDSNYFNGRGYLNGNGGESIRVGTSATSTSYGFNIIEYNYFEGMVQTEPEIISNKTCFNTYRYNTFKNCSGGLTLRHGRYCTVYGNFFIVDNPSVINSYGIRIIDKGHKVFNNYIEGVNGNTGSLTSLRCPIILYNGQWSVNDTTNPAHSSGYWPADSSTVAFNTIVNCKGGAGITIAHTDGNTLTFQPLGMKVANNIIRMSTGQASYIDPLSTSATYFAEGNVYDAPAGSGLTNPTGFTSASLSFGARQNGILAAPLLVQDAALNSGNYSLLNNIDAQGQTRSLSYDIGCDEINGTGNVISYPLDASLVGAGNPTSSTAAVYYWVGGTGTPTTPVIVSDGVNWNTTIGGGGTNRPISNSTTSNNNDILIFDGSNLGGGVTGPVYASISASRYSGQLKLINNANITVGRTTTGSASYIVNGDGSAKDDFEVRQGCTLTIGGQLNAVPIAGNFDVNIQLVSNLATGLIAGNLYLSPLSSVAHTRSYITVQEGAKLLFATGGACYINDSTATSGFDASDTSSITFNTGSSLYYYSGRSPIGSNSGKQFVVFEPGSNFYLRANNYLTSSSWSSSKNYANLFIQNGATFTSDGTFFKIEDLTIDNGSSLITHTSGATPLLGNLVVNGSISYLVGSSNNLLMGGHSPQSISGTGTLTVPNFIVANYSDVTLLRNVQADISAQVFGKINFGSGNKITGPSTFTSKVRATATSVTGNTVAGSYQITGIPANALSGNLGLFITGTGVDGAVNVIHTTSGSGIITMSKPATTTATGTTFSFNSDTSTLVTANPNGMDSLNGSVIVTGTKSFQSGTNYIINAPTNWPFGISSSAPTSITLGKVQINASVTTNRNITIKNGLYVNAGTFNIRPVDTVNVTAFNFLRNPQLFKHIKGRLFSGMEEERPYVFFASGQVLPFRKKITLLPLKNEFAFINTMKRRTNMFFLNNNILNKLIYKS